MAAFTHVFPSGLQRIWRDSYGHDEVNEYCLKLEQEEEWFSTSAALYTSWKENKTLEISLQWQNWTTDKHDLVFSMSTGIQLFEQESWLTWSPPCCMQLLKSFNWVSLSLTKWSNLQGYVLVENQSVKDRLQWKANMTQLPSLLCSLCFTVASKSYSAALRIYPTTSCTPSNLNFPNITGIMIPLLLNGILLSRDLVGVSRRPILWSVIFCCSFVLNLQQQSL